MSSPDAYIHPEISLLRFHERVLTMALDSSLPLLERLRFLSIFSSNLDEFFEIRVSGLSAIAKGKSGATDVSGLSASEVLDVLSQHVHELVGLQYQTLNEVIMPALDEEGVRFLTRKDWSDAQRKWLKDYFKREVLPILTPIRLDPAHPFPLTINKGLTMIVDLHDKERDERHNIAVVPVPRALPRFIQLPEELSESANEFIYLSAIIRENIKRVFTGVKVDGCYQFRITRNSDLYVDFEEVEDLARTLEGELPSRLYGEAIRLEVSQQCPERIVKFLQTRFQLEDQFIYRVDGPVNLNRLIELPDRVNLSKLKFSGFVPSIPEELGQHANIFETLKHHDILLHHPFQSFSPVIDMLRQSAQDPNVLLIKQTLYRTGSNSIIIELLAEAARRGKEVTAVIELMARFDEENNLATAQRLQEAGVHVVYGLVGKKTHAKMIMVVRREGKQLKRYAHLGTGNYHAGNTRLYTDYGFLTADKEITSDVHEIFMQLTTQSPNPELSKLSQSPLGIRDQMLAHIEREIEHANAGRDAKIIIKSNGLSSPKMIDALYAASAAGVQIELIIRGICCLKPGIEGLSENIRVRSVLGRFLEHTRVFYFLNDNDEQVFIASADWMPRNLLNRIEQCTPIADDKLKQRIIEELEIYLREAGKAWLMQSDGSYVQNIGVTANDEIEQLTPALVDPQQLLLEKLALNQ